MLRQLKFILILAFSMNLIHADNTTTTPIFFPKAEVINNYTTRIPFKLVDHLIVVEAELLDKKGNFIIDTGSEVMVLNKVHFSKFYTHQRINRTTAGILQSIDNPYKRNIKKFALENLRLHNKKSMVIDLSHIEKSKKVRLLGIIGYDILKDYEVFVDLYLNQITLTKVDRFGNPLNNNVYLEKITDSLNFKLKRHTIIVNGTVNNQKVRLGIDTAAEFNQINKSINKKALKYYFPKRRLTLSGIGNKKIRVLAGKLHRVKLSETVYFGPMLTILTNLGKMNEAFGSQLDGILGYEFFAQKRTIINYQKEKLYFIDYPLSLE